MPGPPPDVLDLFAVPDVVEALPGGQGASVRAGDLVLSPGRDAEVALWLSPVLARLAVRLDEAPRRTARDLRVGMPVPARDGAWVVQGWGATRWEPGTTVCRDLAVTLAAGRLLHAELASAVRTRPAGLDQRRDRWARAARWALGPAAALDGAAPDLPLVGRVATLLDDTPLGPAQLVHADLAGNVLLDARGAPVVIDVAPAWAPVRWAEAVCVLDSVLWLDAPWSALATLSTAAERQALLRAVLFRVLSDGDGGLEPAHVARYEAVVSGLVGAAG